MSKKSLTKLTKEVPCPGKQSLKSTKGGCLKCEDSRITSLEIEVNRLREEVERMKGERKLAENAIERAILRGTRVLGGRFKPIVSQSIEEGLETCGNDMSSVSPTPSFEDATKITTVQCGRC